MSSRVPRRFSAYVHLVGWVVLLLSGSPGAAEARTRYVLLLHSFDRHFASFDTFVNVFRTELSRQSPDPVVFFEASLQLGPESQSPDDAVVEQYLQSALGHQHVDLVVSIGGPAAVFAQKHAQQLFPTTPALFAAVDERFLQTNRLVAGQTAVAGQARARCCSSTTSCTCVPTSHTSSSSSATRRSTVPGRPRWSDSFRYSSLD